MELSRLLILWAARLKITSGSLRRAFCVSCRLPRYRSQIGVAPPRCRRIHRSDSVTLLADSDNSYFPPRRRIADLRFAASR